MIKIVVIHGRCAPHVFCDVCGKDLTLNPDEGLAVNKLLPRDNKKNEEAEIKFACMGECDDILYSQGYKGSDHLNTFCVYLLTNVCPTRKSLNAAKRSAARLSQL